MDGNRTSRPHLYLSHAWTQEEEGDFAYLARQLRAMGLDATYDSIELPPESSLWNQTFPRIASGKIDGWGYLLTPGNLKDRRCRDELLRALDRAYEVKGPGFPLFGLLHGIAAQNLPPELKLRPCVHLADPGWKEQVQEVMAPHLQGGRTEFCWKIHESYGGDISRTAIEVCPKGDGIRNWRFAVPVSVPPVEWGHGPAGGGEISPFRFSVVRGTGRLENTEIAWFGSEDALSSAESAYAVFHGRLPDFICFGRAGRPTGPPGRMEIFHVTLNRQ